MALIKHLACTHYKGNCRASAISIVLICLAWIGGLLIEKWSACWSSIKHPILTEFVATNVRIICSVSLSFHYGVAERTQRARKIPWNISSKRSYLVIRPRPHSAVCISDGAELFPLKRIFAAQPSVGRIVSRARRIGARPGVGVLPRGSHTGEDSPVVSPLTNRAQVLHCVTLHRSWDTSVK